MARKASTTSAKTTAVSEADTSHSCTVKSPSGVVNVRANPDIGAKILKRLNAGEKVKIDTKVETTEGWKAVDGGGYVLSMYLE